jgi:hypothetical protein
MIKKHTFRRKDIALIYLVAIIFVLPICILSINNSNDILVIIPMISINLIYLIYILTFIRQRLFVVYLEILDDTKEMNLIKHVNKIDILLFVISALVYSGSLLLYNSIENKGLFLVPLNMYFYFMFLFITGVYRRSIYVNDEYIIYKDCKIFMVDINTIRVQDTRNEMRKDIVVELKDSSLLNIYITKSHLDELKSKIEKYRIEVK